MDIPYLAQDGMRTGATPGPPLARLGQLDPRMGCHTGLYSCYQLMQPWASGWWAWASVSPLGVSPSSSGMAWVLHQPQFAVWP